MFFLKIIDDKDQELEAMQEDYRSELLRSIRADRAELPSAGAPGKVPALPDTVPFELPRGWVWAHFPDLGTFGRGKSKHRPRDDPSLFNNGTHPLVQTGDVARSNGLITTYTGMYNDLGLAQSLKWPKGTLCITIAANIADSGILSFDACFPDSVVGFVPAFPLTSAQYFEYVIRTAKANLLQFAPATAQKNINLEILNAVLIPLPPLAEQQRIVSKIDQLMKLCDHLEVAQGEHEQRRIQVSSSALNHLSNGSSSDELRRSSRFYLNHIADFVATPSQIPELRRTILTLAVRGRLAPQNQKEEPASGLIQRIQSDKSHRIVAGSLRKEKALPPVSQEDEPFGVPPNWIWTRIGTCALKTDYGTSVKSDEMEEGVPVLAMGNIQNGNVVLDRRKKVPRQIEDLPQLFLNRFDLLYNRTNSAELVGKTGIYLGRDDEYTFASYLIRIRFLLEVVNPVFVNIAMNAPYFRETQIVPELRRQCGQANVNGTKLRNMLIPLPPISEQHRIVKCVNELLALCDSLEAGLRSVHAEKDALLETIFSVH